jgi:hypothetical protein
MNALLRICASFLFFASACACAEEPVAHAGADVHKRKDVVTLNDGTEVKCTVLTISDEGVLIAETDDIDTSVVTKRLIPKNRIKGIVRGDAHGGEAPQTEVELAQKVVRGKGFSDVEIHKETDETKRNDIDTGVKVARKKETIETPAPVETIAAAPEKESAAPEVKKTENPASVTAHPDAAATPQAEPPEVILSSKELTEAYMARFPELQSTALDLFGAERIEEVFESARNGNDAARRDLETFLQPFIGIADADTSGSPKTVPNRLNRLNRLQQIRPEPAPDAQPAK